MISKASRRISRVTPPCLRESRVPSPPTPVGSLRIAGRVVICLAPEKNSVAIPIGIADLEKREMGGPQNRCAGFGLAIHKDFRVRSAESAHRSVSLTLFVLQGKGYATEAMEWLLRRAFIGYNLHRVEGTCALSSRGSGAVVSDPFRTGGVWSWNDGALKLYDKL